MLPSQRLSSEGEAALRAIIEESRLPDLGWPDFADLATEVKEFYEAAGFKLAWVSGSRPTKQALTLIELFCSAEGKGLDPVDYDGPRWAERLSKLEHPDPRALESDPVRFDVALTVSAMRYISHLHVGRVNPRELHFGLSIDHNRYDLSEFLEKGLVETQDVRAAIEAIEPPFPVYLRTRKALAAYLELARNDDGEPLPASKKVVKPGDEYAGLPRLTRLLRSLGDIPTGVAASESATFYQGALVDAVKHFQGRHGLQASGQIDLHTWKELNTPLNRRVVQLQLSLERMRWLPHEFARPPIVVNIPEFRLRAVNAQYYSVLSMDVVLGEAYRHRTPVFASKMTQVIFRPYWYVPPRIQRDELVPLVEKNRDYLVKHNYEIVDQFGQVARDTLVTDAVLKQLRAGQLALRQKPGPTNALGLVKFSLPNPYDVYLHGTPATALFSRARRDFSHGCIRVEDPVALAVWILRDKPEWSIDHIRAAMYGERTIVVNIDRPIPVLILYGTAVVREDGDVCFFDDIYGHDAALEQALAKRAASRSGK